jgi:predicted enzyme related to lactoylglutathione lyase
MAVITNKLNRTTIDLIAGAVVAQGGKIITRKWEVPTVGPLIRSLYPEGNVVCA